MTMAAPDISGAKNSRTDTSKENGVFCNTRVTGTKPISVQHPEQAVADVAVVFIAPLGWPVEPDV